MPRPESLGTRGHWEGNTLVVETTHFNGKLGSTGNPVSASPELKVVERITRTEADVLRWEATITDPKTYTRPFTISIPYTSPPGYQVPNYQPLPATDYQLPTTSWRGRSYLPNSA